MGRFKYLVDSPALIVDSPPLILYFGRNSIDREVGDVVIPMIAFIEGGITLPMGSITRDYLRNHRLCPHQCAPNLFRVLGAVDALNQHLGLGLT